MKFVVFRFFIFYAFLFLACITISTIHLAILAHKNTIFITKPAIATPLDLRLFILIAPSTVPTIVTGNPITGTIQPRDEIIPKINDVQEPALLSGFEKSYPHQLSGGMNQRASLARALVGHPKILLLDEPLGALDAFTRMTMQDEILRIRQENSMTMVMVTHDVDEAVYLSDYIIVMTPRPAKVEKIIKIEMSHPRARSQDVFLQYRTEILKILNYAGKINEVEYSI